MRKTAGYTKVKEKGSKCDKRKVLLNTMDMVVVTDNNNTRIMEGCMVSPNPAMQHRALAECSCLC